MSHFWMLFIVFSPLLATDIVVYNRDGSAFEIDVPEGSTIKELSALLGEDYQIELQPKAELPPCPTGGRNYLDPLTQNQRDDVHYIVKILAYKPLVKIPLYKSALDRAGDRLDRIHPFHFLEAIFTDEECKVGVRNIRKRGWVWKEFVGGVKRSCAEEVLLDNLKEEYLIDFCQIVGIDPEIIRPALNAHDWEEVVILLMKHVPREGDDDRYDI